MSNRLIKKIFIVLFIALLVVIIYIFLFSRSVKELTITYPHDETLFPLDIAQPTVLWNDETDADKWTIRIEFQETKEPLEIETVSTAWTPERNMWESIKEKSLEKTAKLTVLGFKNILGIKKIRSKKTISIKTSNDEVGAPIFFRAVTLPFDFAVKNMETIRWCLGDISSEKSPRIVLENMMICGNCHSFTADGNVMGMDVDYANDKGSYVISEVSEDIMLTKDKIFTWAEYKKETSELTFGLLSQISPDGKYVVSTVKDRSVFVPIDDLYYSQLFFPLKGILVYYSIETKSFHPLPGADDKEFVQSNPSWSPDSKYIVFARNKAESLKQAGDRVILKREQCEEFITGGKKFRFDLYRIPFNDGKGGEAEPLEGASGDGMSNYFAKYSPDGKWIVFCKADSFMLLQPDSKLYIIPAEGGKARKMRCNTNQMNSWHSWSPNGKWMVFSSKANTPYTQLFLTHIDEEGNDSPPVVLSSFTNTERAANIPEFVNIKQNDIKHIHQLFLDYYSYARKARNMLRYEKDKEKEAEELLKKSLELNPKYIISNYYLGLIYNMGNETDKARKQFKTIIEIDPDFGPAHAALGNIQFSKGNFDEALKEYEIFKKLEPADDLYSEFETNRVYFNLGYTYSKKNMNDKAEKIFLELLKSNQDYDKNVVGLTKAEKEVLKEFVNRIHFNLGTIYMNEEKYDKAEDNFRSILKTAPNASSVYLKLGKVLSASDKSISEAISMYNKALSLKPSEVQGHIELGNIYIRIGDTKKAIDELEKALSLNPPNSLVIKAKILNLKQQL